MKREDALALWKEEIAKIEADIEANKAEKKRLLSRKGKLKHALEVVEKDLDDYPLTTDIEA